MQRALEILPLTMLVACSSRGAAPMAPLPSAIAVETALVELRAMPRALPVTGTLVANRRSEVATNAAGTVVRTFVERGDLVRAGTPLVQLDRRAATLSDSEARANLRNARTQAELAKSTCTRNDLLLSQHAISKEEWERVDGQCRLSLGAAEAAQARAQLVGQTLADATVRAPFSGVISDRYVNVGEYVQPPTKVVDLVELDPLRLQLTVTEGEVASIRSGQTVTFEVEAYGDERFAARVRYIDPTVRSSTRDLVVEAAVANADRRLRPGMFATAHLQLPDAPLLVVPRAAVRRDGATTRIFAVVNGRVEERVVQLGPERSDHVAILDGAKAGDRVVLRPGADVRDGVPVK